MKLSEQCIEAIENNANTWPSKNQRAAYSEGATEALTNPSIYEKAGLIQSDDLLPESFKNEKVLVILTNSLRHLNAEQLAHLLKSITQRSKEATTKAGLISLEDAADFYNWADLKGWYTNGVNWWNDANHTAKPITTDQLFQIYQEQKQKK